MTPQELQAEAHANAVRKGFWSTAHDHIGTKIALIHAEASELLEAHRDGPTAPCDKQGLDLSREQEESADVLLRLLDLCERRGFDLFECAEAKHAYNLTRPHKHGGKAF